MTLTGSQKGLTFSKLVSVSSSDAESGTTSNFLFNAGPTLQQVSRVSIASVSFFNNFYNIYNDTRGSNNSYTYSFGNPGTTRTFTLTPGFYNINSILNLMNADLVTNAAGAVVWTFNSITNMVSLTFTASAGNTFKLNPGTSPPLGLMTTLGGGPFLLAQSWLLTTPPAAITGDTFPLLSGPTQVYLRSRFLTPANGIMSEGTFINTLLAIPVSAAPLTMNVFECKVDNLCEIAYRQPRNINQIDIQLTDKFGNILDLHGGSLNIELRVWYNVQ